MEWKELTCINEKFVNVFANENGVIKSVYKNKKEYVIKYLNGEKMDSVPFDNLKYNSVPFEYNF